MKIHFKNYLTILSGALILMLFAFYDKYPIMTSDTGSYITSGFTLEIPADRPVFYGLFIRLTSLGMSLWLTVFFQCLLLSYVLTTFIKKLIPGITNLQATGFLLFTSLFTICGWFAGQLMPDIFTAILILATTCFLVFPGSGGEKILLAAVIFLCALVHNSNFIVLTLFSAALFVFTFFRSKTKHYRSGLIVLFSISILSWVFVCTSNLLGGHGFTASRSTHVFVMGTLVESGVLKTYLDKSCPEKQYRICAYKDSLPPVAWEFHWDAASPLQKTGGWEANRQEYNTIIRDILSQPEYYPRIMYESIKATASQLVLYKIDGTYSLPWMKFDEGTPPYEAVREYFPQELKQLEISRQNTKAFNPGFHDAIFLAVIILTTIAVLITLPKNLRKEFYTLLCWIGALMVLNAFVTAILSSVNARFNARVIWIVPFINVIMLYKAWRYQR